MALRTPLSVTPHLYMGDSTGRPLDKGVVYFGEQDKDPEFYPINLFSDDALTKPLMQPVHTKGGYLYDKGDMVEPHAKEIIYSVKVLDSYGRKVFYKGAMMRNSWNDDVIEQINDAVFAASDEAKAIFEDAAEESKKNAQSMVNDAINNTAVEGGVLADTFVTVDNKLNQSQLNTGLESIDQLLNIINPKNGFLVSTKSYHAGLNKGGNTYRYNSARAAENDGGSIINGWEVVGKDVLTVWDFGYEVGNELGSTTALKKAVESKVPLQFLDEVLDTHGFTSCEIDGYNKTVFGEGHTRSLAPKLKIKAQNGSFLFKGFSSGDLGLNVGITVLYYDQLLIEDYSVDICYDGVLVWRALDATKSKALVKDCFASRAGRIGFTADIDAANVVFENCHTDLSYQGFHAEKCLTLIDYVDCVATRCGRTPADVTHAPDQPLAYAGGFIASGLPHVRYTRCKNIDKTSGINRDYIINDIDKYEEYDCDGLQWYIEENEGRTITDVTISGSKNGSMQNYGFKHIMRGRLVLENLKSYGGIEFTSHTGTSDPLRGFSEVFIKNIDCKRLTIRGDTQASLVVDNLKTESTYWIIFSGFKDINIGRFENNFTGTDRVNYSVGEGVRIDGSNLEIFNMTFFYSSGSVGGGTQIDITNLNSTIFKGGVVGKMLIPNGANMMPSVDFKALNITYMAALNDKAVSSTTAKLSDKDDAINTNNKYLGREVYNSTSSKFVKATGSSATANWVYADGTAAITPV